MIHDAMLFAKATPSPPVGSSAELVHNTNLFYRSEHEAYVRLGPHPRILRYHGWDRRGLLFDSHPAGDILRYLLQNRDSPPPLSVRLQWACDVAEGLAFVHSRGLVWVDVALNNVLLSTDHRAIISDFAGCCILPLSGQKPLPVEYQESQISVSIISRSPHPRPEGILNWAPVDDRFGFGIALFSLLTFRFPHSPDLVVRDFDLAQSIYLRHQSLDFDTLGVDPEYRQLEAIIQKCFTAQYQSSDKLLEDLLEARAAMPPGAPLLQDKVNDPMIDFSVYPPGRELYPFDQEDDLEV
ncbi:kinase-like domain-containing protein [Mycena galericulata]|nr:kinase-like domain-containing protein [Mycena galericulata]